MSKTIVHVNMESIEEEFTRGSIKRLLQKGGVSRIKRDVYGAITKEAFRFVATFLHTLVLVATRNGNVTIKHKDLKIASEILGIECSVGINPNTSTTPSLKTGKAFPSSSTGKIITESSKVIKFQKQNDSLVFPLKTFINFCKKIARDPYIVDIKSKEIDLESLRYSKTVITVLQVICERYLLSVIQASWNIVLRSKRSTLSAIDIQESLVTARNLSSYANFF